MKFLTRLGMILNQGLQIAGVVAPAVKVLFPGQADKVEVISQDLAQVAEVIVQVEAFGQALSLPGPQKLQASVGPVTQILLRSALVANHKVADEALFKAGAQKIADGMADILNSLKDKIETEDKAA